MRRSCTQARLCPAGPLGLGQRWTVARNEAFSLLRDEPVQFAPLGVRDLLGSTQFVGGIDASLKRKGGPVQALVAHEAAES